MGASATAVSQHGGPMTLETANLLLEPWHPAQLLALLEQPERFAELAGRPAAPGLRELYASGTVSREWIAALRGANSPDPWQHGFRVAQRDAGIVIGSAGFKGLPAGGLAEIAYGIAPPFEGKGYATEAARALIAFAFGQEGVERLRAHTLPVANASTRVLTKCGFSYVGTFEDPEDGQVWRWERGLP